MAATGKTPILLYGSTTATNAPAAGNLTNSSDGCEIAINVADKNLFFKDATNTVNTVPIRQSSASSDGWLSSTDWSTFNNKQPAGSYLTSVTVDAPLTGAGTSGSHLSIPAASGSTNGYLSSTDWTTFNSKQPAGSYALTTGTLAQFASTTSAQLAGVISDETGSGSLVFGTGPTLTNAVYKLSGNGATFGISDTAGTAVNQYFDCTLAPGGGAYNYLKFNFGGNDILTWGYTLSAYANTLTLNAPTSSGNIVFKNNGTQVGKFDTGTNLQVSTGNLVIGTSGKGIDFSATAGTGTSELLADYEEGTWTPTLAGGTTAGDYALSSINAYYTKIGNQVTVNARFTVTVNSAGTGTAKFGGLPYAKGANQYIAGSVYSSGVTYAANIISLSIESWTSSSSSDFAIAGVRSATTVSDLAVTNIASTNSFYMTFTYFV